MISNLEFQEIYALLLSKFCHDITSPINALSLIFELLETHNLKEIDMAKQSCQDIFDILAFYKILFLCNKFDAFDKVVKYFKNICKKKNIQFSNNIIDTESVSEELSKIFLCVFFIFLSKNKQIKSIFIEKNQKGTVFSIFSDSPEILKKFKTIEFNKKKENELNSKLAINLFLQKLLEKENYQIITIYEKDVLKLIIDKNI
ncbi:MAG: hypothetical protein LBS83_02340 [Holosporales bacterium]|jgi:hypothetical protein|nr:hypothetical protein [Holosporales bacterium]